MQIIIGRDFPVFVIPLIDNSKTAIDIVVFDWRWYPQEPGNPVQLFNQSIVRAVRRGVQVRAISNSLEIIATLKSVGVNAKKLITKNLVHCKIMIIDNEFFVVGSHNYTQSAFTYNHELSIIEKSREIALQLTNYFNNLFKNYG